MRHQQVILACPEMLGGLACPRQPAEIIGGTAQDVLGHAKVMTQQGERMLRKPLHHRRL